VNYLFTPPDNGYISSARVLVESLSRIWSDAHVYFTLSGQMCLEIKYRSCAHVRSVRHSAQDFVRRELQIELAEVVRLTKSKSFDAGWLAKKTAGLEGEIRRLLEFVHLRGIARTVRLTVSRLIPTISMLIL